MLNSKENALLIQVYALVSWVLWEITGVWVHVVDKPLGHLLVPSQKVGEKFLKVLGGLILGLAWNPWIDSSHWGWPIALCCLKTCRWSASSSRHKLLISATSDRRPRTLPTVVSANFLLYLREAFNWRISSMMACWAVLISLKSVSDWGPSDPPGGSPDPWPPGPNSGTWEYAGGGSSCSCSWGHASEGPWDSCRPWSLQQQTGRQLRARIWFMSLEQPPRSRNLATINNIINQTRMAPDEAKVFKCKLIKFKSTL